MPCISGVAFDGKTSVSMIFRLARPARLLINGVDPVRSRPRTIEFLIVTLSAWMLTTPRMSSPSITVPALVIFRSPLWTVREVPDGTPVLDAPGVPVDSAGVGVGVGVGFGAGVGF